MSNQKSDSRQATKDLVDSVRSVFKDYSKSARRKSWDALTSSAGKTVVNKLIADPKVPVIGISRLLSFKEWLNHSSRSE